MRRGDTRRDAGFSIFYMGINLGAFIAPLICGYLGQRVNWHAGFACAGFGMVIGIVQYMLGGRYLGDAGARPATAGSPAAAAAARRQSIVWGLVLLAAAVIVGGGAYTGAAADHRHPDRRRRRLHAADPVRGVLRLAVPRGDWTPEERKRLYVIGVFFLAAALFWSLFEQAGSTLNLFADRDTRTTVFGWSYPSSWFQSMNSMFVWAFAPVFAWLWMWLGRRRQEPSTPIKFSLGLILVGAGFAVLIVAARLAQGGVQVSPVWLTVVYLLHTFGELCLSPVGLSAMTKLAPARIAGLMMGVWFLATSVGNFIAGRLAGFYESMPLPTLFTNVALFGIVAGLILLALSPPIKRLMGEVN